MYEQKLLLISCENRSFFYSVRSSLEDPPSPCTLPLLLQCLLSLLTHIPADITSNPHFKRFVTTKLSPTLITYLDLADTSSSISSSVLSSSVSSGMMIKGSLFKKRSKKRTVELTEVNVKTLVAITMELSRLLGKISKCSCWDCCQDGGSMFFFKIPGPAADMRPILECVFHRMFICSQKKNRYLPMQAVGEVSKLYQFLNLTFAPLIVHNLVSEKTDMYIA